MPSSGRSQAMDDDDKNKCSGFLSGLIKPVLNLEYTQGEILCKLLIWCSISVTDWLAAWLPYECVFAFIKLLPVSLVNTIYFQ